MKRLFIAFVLITLNWIWTGLVAAIDYNSNGPFFDGNSNLTIAKDSSFSQKSLSFTPGETVYLKIESSNIINTSSSNTISLKSYDNNNLINTSFVQASASAPYQYTASFVYPNNGVYTQLVILLRDSAGNRFNIQQTLETTGLNQYARIYRDNAYSQESYVFKSSSTLYLKAYGNTNASKKYNQNIYDLAGNRYSSTYNQYTINGNWYTLPINISSLGLPDKQWYWLYADSFFANRSNFFIGRLFYLDNTNPTVSITAPTSGSNLSGTVTITGTAIDTSFVNYNLAWEKSTNLGVWTTIGTYTNQVSNDTLGLWDTNSLAGGTYTLRLIASDQAGNTSQVSVTNLVKVSYSGTFSVSVPSFANLSSVTVKPIQQISSGQIGAGTGINDIKVIDDRGTFAGWSLTMTMSDFYSGTQVLPVTYMTVTPTDITATIGSLAGLSKGMVHTFTNDSDPAAVMVAQSGSGTGTYWNDVSLQYIVPPYPKAGSYTAVVDFSLQ